MSKIYQLIQDQVDNIVRILSKEDVQGNVYYPAWLGGNKYVKPVIQVLSLLLFILVVLFFGVQLWNYGLQPVLPGVVAKIDPSNLGQDSNPMVQMLLTLLALMVFL